MVESDGFDIAKVSARVEALKQRYRDRDRRMRDVQAVRRGDFDSVAPDLFNDEWPRPIVANLIDSSAKAAAGALSTLPSFNCRVGQGLSDTAKQFADKRTKIAENYLTFSAVGEQMVTAADQFFTYGLIVACVEPDLDGKMPRITYEDSFGVYPVWNRAGDTIAVARVFTRTKAELCAEYPEYEEKIKRSHRGLNDRIEVVKFVDDKRVIHYIPECDNLVLHNVANPLGECYYVCTKKPGLDDEIRGNYDDLIWVQLARHSMQMYALEAAAKAVQAPLAVPQDVGDVTYGPDAIIRTANPAAVRRVDLQVPAQTWGSIEHLKQELLTSAVVPPSPGSIDASIITGAGVRELMGGYSQEIATAQETLKGHFRRVIRKCFRMDELVWPESRKSLRGVKDGVPYDVKYTPRTDIKGDYTVEVTYGFQAGLDANRALILLLQAQGAGLVSRDFARRGLPGGVNAAEEESKILTEQMRDSIAQGLSALSQSIPQLVANGQDPTPIVQAIARITDLTQKGRPIEEVVVEVLAPAPPPEPSTPEGSATTPGASGDESGSGGASGFGPNGLPSGLTPGEVTGGPNERPDLQMLFAGISGAGKPVLQGGVSRYTPAR